ncbi:MAG TPA: DNA primase, partial [Azoarcus taiwanensis]|nr:DNA primase [Azoarcus taiwanensis]
MASNHDDVVDQLTGAGLLVDHLVVGKMQRCKVEGDRERRGWYVLHELTLDGGDVVLVGSYGVWQGDDNGASKILLQKRTLTADQKAAIRARLAEDRKRADAQRHAEAKRAAERAEAAWRKCVEEGESDYLTRKGIRAHGVRFSPQGAIVVPMMDTGARVHGLQFILSRKRHADRIKRTGRDKEFWPAGLSKRGHFHLLGMPTWILLVAEGYATAASLHEATGLPVAVAFDAGNLLPVAEAL